MKNKFFAACMFFVLALVSCKEEARKETEPAKETEKSIQLSNYSDTNWKAGVGIEFPMFLADNTPSNLALIKDAKVLEFEDGTKIDLVSYKEEGNFIQLIINDKGSNFQNVAQYPSYIFVK
jgi:hypothetical protein